MDARVCNRVLTVTAGLAVATAAVVASTGGQAQENPPEPALYGQDSLPPSVTPQMITQGAQLFTGAGLCLACHGPNAKGVPNLGPDLTDTTWVQTDGSFEQIAAQINKGVTAAESKTGVVMPPRGGSAINDEQVRAVAAYVWSLSRR